MKIVFAVMLLAARGLAALDAAPAADSPTSPVHSTTEFESADLTVPGLLSFQGKLTDSLGVPVPDSTYSVLLRLYTQPSGGTHYWQETQSVATEAGLFSVLLGSTTPVPRVPEAGNLYLGMKVGSDPEMTPRVRIVSAAYAFRADTAAYAHAAPLSGVGGSGTVGLLARWSGATTIGNSSVRDNGSDNVAVGANANPRYRIYGHYSSSSYGCLGLEDNGVQGFSGVDSGSGVYGSTNSTTGYGVYGRNSAPSYGYLGGRSYGVYGEGNSAGVYGYSSNRGVQGAAPGGATGILGASDPQDAGVYGSATGSGEYGVYGYATGTDGIAVHGLALGGNGIAVKGFTGASSNTAVQGISGSGTGVEGQGNPGVYGQSSGGTAVSAFSGPGGSSIGVQGIGYAYGVKGNTPSGTAGKAVSGESMGTFGYGVEGIADNTGGRGVYGTSDNGQGGEFQNDNNSYYALTARNNTGAGVTVRGLYVQGHGYASGGWQSYLDGGGTGFALASQDLELVASGSSRLVDGAAAVEFEPQYRQAISGAVDVRVIVTPTSACHGIFVSDKAKTGFMVRELDGGSSDAQFDWIAIGRLRGAEQRVRTEPPAPGSDE